MALYNVRYSGEVVAQVELDGASLSYRINETHNTLTSIFKQVTDMRGLKMMIQGTPPDPDEYRFYDINHADFTTQLAARLTELGYTIQPV